MNVSLPKSLADWVDEQVESGRYGTTSEVVRDALRELQQRSVRDQIEANLLRSLKSGKPIPVTPEFWKERRRELERRMRRLRRKRA